MRLQPAMADMWSVIERWSRQNLLSGLLMYGAYRLVSTARLVWDFVWESRFGAAVDSREEASHRNAGNSASYKPVAQSRTQVLCDFFNLFDAKIGSGAIRSDEDCTLAVWQGIVLAVGLCKNQDGLAVVGQKKPGCFPEHPLDLPATLDGCRRMIREYVFVNIVNFRLSQSGVEELLLFDRYV